MVALTIRTWHPIMLMAELSSIVIYFLSLIVLKDLFGKCSNNPELKSVRFKIFSPFLDSDFIQTGDFVWKTLVITAVSCLPLYLIKFLRYTIPIIFTSSFINQRVFIFLGKDSLHLLIRNYNNLTI